MVNLKELREGKGLSQKRVAETVGMSQPSYWAIEHGEAKPSVANAKKIGEVLGIPWTSFFEDEAGEQAN